MNAKQWKAGLLSVAMLASMVVPAAAATPEEALSEQPAQETSLVTEVVPAADNEAAETQTFIFAFPLDDVNWHEYRIEVPAITIPEGSDHERIVAQDDEACRAWLTENVSEVPTLEELLAGSGVDASLYSDISFTCIKWVDHGGYGEWHADFTLVEKGDVEEPDTPPEFGPVWGPTGENWGISLTLTCTNDAAAHKGGNSDSGKKNFISSNDWDLENADFYQKDGVWYATCSLNAEALLTEQFGEGHTVTANPELTLVYQNNKWCIQSEENPVQITVEGTCDAASPAAPVLGTNMDIWVQTYLGEYDPVGGGLLGNRPSTYGPSLTIGDPYESEGKWLCDVTIVGYTSDAESSEQCFVNKILSNYPQYTIDPAEVGEDGTATKTITLTYNQGTGKWVAPELPKEYTSNGPGDTVSKPQNGVAFKLVEKGEEPDPNTPEAPNKDNCSYFFVTVYGAVPQMDGTVVNKVLLGYRWDVVPSNLQVTYEFGQPTKNEAGIWTCDMTIDASQMVTKVQADHNTYRIVEEDPSVKTITLTYNEKTQKWSAPSDGVTYGYPSKPETKNGVAFKLLQQFSMTFTPGLNGEGEEYESPLYDAGTTVKLPETTEFTRDGYVFAGWRTSIKEGTQTKVYIYPIGSEITVFPKEDLELDAYWMNVDLSVATTVYDPAKAVKDYDFSSDGVTIENPSGEITLLYKATVKGNSEEPYVLECDGAQAAYDTALSGAIKKYNTTAVVYFTKTYSVEDTMDIQETVTMGNASDSVSATVDVASLTASGANLVYTGAETSYTFTAAGMSSDKGTMEFSFLLDGQYVPDSVKLEALNGFVMEQAEPEQTEDGMLYKVMLTQMSGVDALAASKQTEVLRVTLTAADEKGQIVLTPVEYAYASGTTGPDLPGEVGGPVTTQVWVQYDVNDDGQVSMSDVNMLKVYYQAHEGDENWSDAVRADLNGDKVVDVQDLSLLMQYLLQQ